MMEQQMVQLGNSTFQLMAKVQQQVCEENVFLTKVGVYKTHYHNFQ